MLNDDNLQELIHLLKEYLEKGKLDISSGDSVKQSLGAIRYKDNGKIEADSVDGTVRALAKAVWLTKQDEDFLDVPLHQVQKQYFELVESMFGPAFQDMKRNDVMPNDIARSIAGNQETVKAYAHEASIFAQEIRDFWETAGQFVETHIRDLDNLKAVYGGDLFPAHGSIVSRTGLYVDTIILPDPLFKAASLHEQMKPEQALFYLVKSALSVLMVKNAVLADIEPPIAVIAPDYFPVDAKISEFIVAAGEQDVLLHCSKMFGEDFSTIDTLNEFLDGFRTIDDLESRLTLPDRFMFDVAEKDLPISKRWEATMGIMSKFKSSPLADAPIGAQIFGVFLGRMMQTNEAVYKAGRLGGSPLIDAPTSWQYLMWKYEYDQQHYKQLNPKSRDHSVINALQDERFCWLGNAPLDVLVTLRKENKMDDVRDVLAGGIHDIDIASPGDTEKVSNEVAANLEHALKKHEALINKIASEKRFFGLNAGKWAAIGAISLAVPVAPYIALPALAVGVADWLLGIAPSGRELIDDFKRIRVKEGKAIKSPVGLLFEIKGKNM